MFNNFRPVRIFAILCVFLAGVFVVAAQEDDDRTYITGDDALIFTAPDGWSFDVYDSDAAQAELDELGIEMTLPRVPGISIMLESDDPMVIGVGVTVFYGQDLAEFMEMMSQPPAVPDSPEDLLILIATLFERISPDEVELGTLTLSDGRDVLYYDYVDSFDMSDLEGLDLDLDSLGMPASGDDEIDAMLDEMMGGMGDMMDNLEMFGDFSSELITRYYALSFDNTGVILVDVTLDSSFDTDNAMFEGMLDMMAGGAVDVAELMAEFLANIQPGDGEVVIVEADPDAPGSGPGAAPSVATGVLNFTVPDGYHVIDQGFGYVMISNSPEADPFAFETEPGMVTIEAIYGDEFAFDLDNFGLSALDDPRVIAEALADELGELLETGPPTITTTRFGAHEGYSFAVEFDGMATMSHIISVDGVGAVWVIAIDEHDALSDAVLRDTILFVVSMLP